MFARFRQFAGESGRCALLSLVTASAGLAAISVSTPLRADPLPFNFTIRTNQERAIGNVYGYSTLAFLAGKPIKRDLGAGMLFGDFRLHVENSGGVGFNVGGGYRWIDFDARLGEWHRNRILGLHAGFDGREYHCRDSMICDKENFYWVNFGFESLGDEWDFRVNGYLGVGRSHREFMLEAIRFTGNNLLVAPFYAEAMWGVDGEIGRRLKRLNLAIKRRINLDPKIYAAIGGYHFAGYNGDNATGIRFRIQANVQENIAVGLRASYDSRFGGLVLGQISFSIGTSPRSTRSAPDGGPSKAIRRLTEFRERQEMIVVGEGLSKRERLLTDDTGTPVPFVHVNNTASAGGDGTFERPYDQLVLVNGTGSAPGDTIVVHGGDGTTTNYDQGVVLQNNQSLIGGQLLGMFTFGGQVVWSKIDLGRPTLTNATAGNVVTVASGNLIQGLDIVDAVGDATTTPDGDPATGHGIFGSGIDGLVVRDVVVSNNASNGIKLYDSQGTIVFDRITCTGNGAGPPVLGANTRDCIGIHRSTTGELNVLLQDSILIDSVGDGLEIDNINPGNADPMTITVVRTHFENLTESAITVGNSNFTASAATITIQGNHFKNIGYSAFEYISFGPRLDLTIHNNIIDGTGTNLDGGGILRRPAISITTNDVISNTSIVGNQISNSEGPAIFYLYSTSVELGPGHFELDIRDNLIQDNGGGYDADGRAGIVIMGFSASDDQVATVNARVENNVFLGNRDIGIGIYTLNASDDGMGGISTFGNTVLCLRLNGNNSDNAMVASQGGNWEEPQIFGSTVLLGGGTFMMETPTGNNVAPTTVGTVTEVAAGTCS